MDLRVARIRKLPPLPSPEESLRNLVERAPQAEAWADGIMLQLRPTMTMLYTIRRRLATAGILIFSLWFFVHVMFGANGMVVYRQKKAEYQNLHTEIDHLQEENQRFSEQIKSLQTDPKAIEKEAREQLHYARPGEVIYVSPSLPNPTASELGTARK
jgi:cell division protein FtsB